MKETTIRTGGGAAVNALYHEVGRHSFVSVGADYGHIVVSRDGVGMEIGGPVALFLSPANARTLAEQILAALPNEAEQKVRIA